MLSFVVHAKERWLPIVAATVREYARVIGFSGQEAQRAALALEEASAYAIRLGYGAEHDMLRISLTQTGLGLQATLRSRGLPLDDDQLPQFDSDRLRSEGDMTGLSSLLIRKMMDQATFSVLPDGEREITMLKHFPAPVQDAHPAGGPDARVDAERRNDERRIRLAGPEDADEDDESKEE